MKLYPAIDLKDSKCVRLLQGDYNKITTYSDDPAQVAKRWEELGGDTIHLVDLDGAKAGKSVNKNVISQIVKAVSIPCELGGGIRKLEDIYEMLELGLYRVILGSAAIKNPSLVSEAIKEFGKEKIVIGVDAKNGMVAVEGWQEVTNNSALDFCKQLEKLGVETVIYTDISKDGMMSGPNIKETENIIKNTSLNVVASGGVSCIEDLYKLKSINVEGAIIGKALYQGNIKLEEAAKLF